MIESTYSISSFVGIGVVHPDVANAAEFVRDAEVQADRFGVADMQIAVRLRRETGANLRVLSAANIFRDDVADKVRRSWIIDRCCHCCVRN